MCQLLVCRISKILQLHCYCLVFLMQGFHFFFFFSSRRRHTRCLSDWSSDVCSSDLSPTPLRRTDIPHPPGFGRRSEREREEAAARLSEPPQSHTSSTPLQCSVITTCKPRSEERRVGKECRSRWSQYH